MSGSLIKEQETNYSDALFYFFTARKFFKFKFNNDEIKN